VLKKGVIRKYLRKGTSETFYARLVEGVMVIKGINKNDWSFCRRYLVAG